MIGAARVPAVFPGGCERQGVPGAEGLGLQASRRPDSNRGPLHYEGRGLETARPVSIGSAGLSLAGGAGETGGTGHSGCHVVPATFLTPPADDAPEDLCDYAGHEWADAGGGLLICLRCEAEKWADETDLETLGVVACEATTPRPAAPTTTGRIGHHDSGRDPRSAAQTGAFGPRIDPTAPTAVGF